MANEQPPEITETGQLKAPKFQVPRRAVLVLSALALIIAYAVFRVASDPPTLEKAEKAARAATKRTDDLINEQVPENVKRQLEADQARSQIAQGAAQQLQQEGPPLSSLANSLGFRGYQNRYNGTNVNYGPGSPYGQYGYGQYQTGVPPQHNSVSAKEQRQEQAKREAEEKAEQAFKSAKMSSIVYRMKEEKESARGQLKETESAPVHAVRMPAIPGRKSEDVPRSAPSEVLYTLYQGHVIDTVLVNGIEAHYAGPLKCNVSSDVWSDDHAAVVIKAGSVFIGSADKVSEMGTERVAVTFDRLIRTDKYSVDLSKDDMPGLSQNGATGLKDKVNHHYVRTIAMAGAMGAIGGLMLANTRGSYGYYDDGADAFRQGFSQQMGRMGMQTFNRYLNMPWDVYIRPGYRVQIFLMRDLELPEEKN